jgi:hypothetical protein
VYREPGRTSLQLAPAHPDHRQETDQHLGLGVVFDSAFRWEAYDLMARDLVCDRSACPGSQRP